LILALITQENILKTQISKDWKKMQPVHVVGYGIIDGLGNNPSDCFLNSLNDKDYTVDLDFMIEQKLQITRGIRVDDSGISLPKSLDEKSLRHMTRTQKIAIHAVEQAMNMSGLPMSSNVAVIYSSVSNDSESIEYMSDKFLNNKRAHPLIVLNRIPDIIASHICGHYGFMGTSFALMASCATGLLSIDYAMRLCDEYDYVIVGGSDAPVHGMAMKYFSALGALGNRNAPFDDSREGFIMADGAGVLILQSSEKVKEFGSRDYAKLYPVGSASDALSLTSPAEDGRGSKIAMKKALRYVENIDVISAHATSTVVGDPIEYSVVSEMLPNTPIYAPKSKTGHTLAASGIIETIYAIESSKNGIIPHCQNLKNCSFDTNKTLTREPITINKEVIRTLNNSFGFGGKSASQVIEVTKND
jgi:3-oxoacyl-[acyl-carrier-protein] synthase II